MVYETINVRMSRSNVSTSWGFTIGSGGGGEGSLLEIAAVARESLAEKASILPSDKISELCGRNTKNMFLSEARNIIDSENFEITLVLLRYVTEHSCLPWQLTEKDKRIIVDQTKPKTLADYNAFRRERTDKYSTHTLSNYQLPSERIAPSEKYISSYTTANKANTLQRPSNLADQASAPFTNATNRDHLFSSSEKVHRRNEDFRDHYQYNSTVGGPQDNLRTGRSSNENTQNIGTSRIVPIEMNGDMKGTKTIIHVPPPPPSPPPMTTTDYRTRKSRPTATYQPVQVDRIPHDSRRSHSYDIHRHSQQSPQAHNAQNRVTFGHSPRTQRVLSPEATINYLQYNSPANLYSADAAAEQFQQQTGKTLDIRSPVNTDAPYLKSETRKLIAEEESGIVRGKSPTMQSSSFKRIARACGTPVD